MVRPLLVLSLAAALASPALADAPAGLPDTLGYTVLVEGRRVGHCDIRTERRGDGMLVLHARLRLETKALNLSLEDETVVDPDTWRPVAYRWSGESNGGPYDGRIRVTGDHVAGRYRLNGGTWSEGTRRVEGPLTLFEDYAIEHQILMARAFAAAGWRDTTITVLRPSTFRFLETTFTAQGERLFQSDRREAVCRKVVIRMPGAAPFASFYDPASGLPVYVAFPGVSTELFLDSFHGPEPETWFVPKDAKSSR